MNHPESDTTRSLVNGRTSLHLQRLRDGEGMPLLLLHDLFGSLADWQDRPIEWTGPVWALDFAGHGKSTWRPGGAYYPELFVTDADAALEEIGTSCLAGIGLGAYVALLLAGARTERVPGTLLLPGTGMEGGGEEPAQIPQAGYLDELKRAHAGAETPQDSATDPRVVLARNDIRPVDYAESFGTRSQKLVLVEDGANRPGWWEAVSGLPNAQATSADLLEAFTVLRQLA